MGRHSRSRDRRSHRTRDRDRSRRHRHRSRSRSDSDAPAPGNTLKQVLDSLVQQTLKDPSVTGVAPGDKSGATGMGSMMLNVTDAMTASSTGVTELSILGIPTYITPDEICNSINILMTSFKLTTGPGNPCSDVRMEGNGSIAIVSFRTPTEATNGLALDGLTVFNHVIHVNRPDNYTGPDTQPPKIDPNMLLQLCTGSNAEKEYEEVVAEGRKLLENYHEKEQEKNVDLPSVLQTADDYKVSYNIDCCVLMHNIPKELDETEIISFCQPFGGFKKLYMLKDKKKRFLGDAVVEYRDKLNYEIAMEGLQDLPIFNETVIKVEKPDTKWPGFPKSVSAISNPSCVLKMSNIITLEDLDDDDDYTALLEDLKEGCERLGTVVSIHVPRIHRGEEAVPGVGFAFVQYNTVLEAASAARALRLKTFNQRQIQVDYYPLALYLKEDYGEIGELV